VKTSGAKIAFVSERDGNSEIYGIDPDGSNLTRLTNDQGWVDDVVWSPDGSRIAFVRHHGGNRNQICVMDADGSNQRCLTDPAVISGIPSWSPDGKKIAFISIRDGHEDIYAMDADGRNDTNLTNSPSWDTFPRWSPDGSKIAFVSSRHASSKLPPEGSWGYGIVLHTELYLMGADGSNVTRLTNIPRVEGRPNRTPVVRYPRWSPNGQRILFLSNRNGRSNLHLIDADGSNLTQVTDRYDPPGVPAWSRDGTKIVFAAFERWNFYPERQPNYEIFVIDVDSLSVTNITNSQDLNESMPTWSPDGRRIVFAARPNDPLQRTDSRTDYDIYVMDADGSNVVRLTDDPARDAEPSWSP